MKTKCEIVETRQSTVDQRENLSLSNKEGPLIPKKQYEAIRLADLAERIHWYGRLIEVILSMNSDDTYTFESLYEELCSLATDIQRSLDDDSIRINV